MTRQERYQLRHKNEGLCHICPLKAVPKKSFCKIHLEQRRVKNRERMRRLLNCKPRIEGGRGRPHTMKGETT